MRKTFPKDGMKKLKQTISDLKAENRRLIKENNFLRAEIENLAKPSRKRKKNITLDGSHEQWRKDFLKRFRRQVLGEE